MKITELSVEQMARFGVTHRFEITYADLVAFAALTGTVDFMAYVAGQGILGGFFKLVTPFVGPAVTNLSIQVGWNGATTDDPDGALAATELAGVATEILFGDFSGAAFATLRTGYLPLDAGIYGALFTAIGANLSVLTAGEVHVYARIANLANI